MYASDSSQSASESAEAVPALNPNADLCDYAHPHPPPPPLRFFADYQVYFNRMIQSCNWEHTLLYFDGNHRVHTHGWHDSTQWHHPQQRLLVLRPTSRLRAASATATPAMTAAREATPAPTAVRAANRHPLRQGRQHRPLRRLYEEEDVAGFEEDNLADDEERDVAD